MPTLGTLGATVQRRVLTRGAWVDLRRGWLGAPSAVFDDLASRVPWQAERREMYDREVDVPRLLAFYAEGAELPSPVLTEARDALSRHYAAELGEPFRTAGLCLYRDGRDSVAWHGDTIGRSRTEDTMVAIVSVGCAAGAAAPAAGWRRDHQADARARRPGRDGRLLPADLGARRAQDGPAGRAADQHPVPAPWGALSASRVQL